MARILYITNGMASTLHSSFELSRLLVERCGFARTTPVPYATTRVLGRRLDHALACLRPQLFSELCLVAHV